MNVYCCFVQERSLQEENKALQKEVSCQILWHCIEKRSVDVLLFCAACREAEGGRQQAAAAGAVGPADPAGPGPDKLIIFLLPDEAGSTGAAASTKHPVRKPMVVDMLTSSCY